MSKKKKNSFENICDKLEENYVLEENQITYIKNYLKSDLKIGEDKDMLLKIKAEAEDTDYNSLLSLVFTMYAMFFTAIGVIIQFIPEMPGIINYIIRLFYLISIIIMLTLAIKLFSGKYDTIKKWRPYVLTVANQLIEQQSENEVDRFDKKVTKLKKKKQKDKK